MVLNTTNGPQAYDRDRPGHVVNTSRAVEEDMTYLDEEAEIMIVIPGTGWQAVIEGAPATLVAWVAMDSGKMYGVILGDDGRIDLTDSVEKHPGFAGYTQVNNHKENQ